MRRRERGERTAEYRGDGGIYGSSSMPRAEKHVVDVPDFFNTPPLPLSIDRFLFIYLI
jgi:hypothetical protein